jgi:hypothetical protein
MTEDDLNELIANTALHIAHAEGLPLKQVIDHVQRVLTAALQEYRAVGTPDGDDFAGFARWLSQRDVPGRPSPEEPIDPH